MRKIIIYIMILFGCIGCEGSFWATGKVFEYRNGSKIPLDSVHVEVFYYRTLSISRNTDSTGFYEAGGLTTPGKGEHWLIFSRPGYQTDTIKIFHRTKTNINQDQIMIPNQ